MTEVTFTRTHLKTLLDHTQRVIDALAGTDVSREYIVLYENALALLRIRYFENLELVDDLLDLLGMVSNQVAHLNWGDHYDHSSTNLI